METPREEMTLEELEEESEALTKKAKEENPGILSDGDRPAHGYMF